MNLTRETTICIITQSHLCRNPRVLKEATTLAKIGYKVQVLISIFSPELLEQDRLSIKGYNISLVPVSDLTKRNFHSLHSRALHKMGRLIVKYLKFETPLALGYSYPEYLRKCLSVGADLYICHQELATYIGTSLIKKGFKVAFDFEDWYSEDLLPDARAQRPIQLLKKCESTALKRGIFSITTSMVLAKKLAQSYSCPLPQVIYNVFPLERALLEKPKEFNKPI